MVHTDGVPQTWGRTLQKHQKPEKSAHLLTQQFRVQPERGLGDAHSFTVNKKNHNYHLKVLREEANGHKREMLLP